MKKRVIALLTAAMVIAMGAPAFAATSPTASAEAAPAAVEYANVEVAKGGVVIDGVVADVAPVIETVTKAQVEEAEQQAKASVAATAKVLQMVDVSLPVSFTSVQLTFEVSGVTAGQRLAVLHQRHDGIWETIQPDAVENNKVTATFTSLSPIAIVAYNASAQTGQQASALPVFAAICLAGMVFCGRKVTYNK